MQAILTEEEYKEYLGLKAGKAVSLEALRVEMLRQLRVISASSGGHIVSNPNAFFRDVCAVVSELPNIAKELAEKK